MSVDEHFNSNQGTAWVQPDGPNTEIYPLACHDIPDLSKPQGDVTQRLCPNRRGGGWRIATVNQGPPDRVTTTVTTFVTTTADWLESNIGCAMPIYIHQNKCGRVDSFLSYERGQVLQYAKILSHSETGLVTRETSDSTEQSFDVSADLAEIYYQQIVRAQASGVAVAINDVTACTLKQCIGVCGSARDLGLLAFAVCDAPAGVNTAEVLVTFDGGVTWAAIANDPYVAGIAAGDNILSVCCFPVYANGHVRGIRVMVVRDDNSAVNAALDIAYSDPDPNVPLTPYVDWTNVNVGAATDVAAGCGALFAWDEQNLYLTWSNAAGAVGYISKSTDGGLTWTAQQTTGDSMNYIKFCNRNDGIAVGDQEEIWLTDDGGLHWWAATAAAPAHVQDALCCDIIDQWRLWVGFEDGQLFFSVDGGITWTRRHFTLPAGIDTATYQINDIQFVDEYCGRFVLQFQTAGPLAATAVYRTTNGGLTWDYVHQAGTFNWNALWANDYHTAYLVGEVLAGAGTIHNMENVP